MLEDYILRFYLQVLVSTAAMQAAEYFRINNKIHTSDNLQNLGIS